MKKFIYSIVGIAVISTLSACSKEEKIEQPQVQGPPPKIVSYITIKEQSVNINSDLKGRLVAVHEAQIRPQITGLIEDINVKDGQEVKKGQILYKVDDAQYLASYNQALAALNSVEADLKVAKLKADRYKELAKDNAVPQQEADETMAQYLKLLSQQKERQAAVNVAKINLDYTKIKAPIDGKIGISNITKGTLVTANQTQSLNTITKLDPIYLDITQQSGDFLTMINKNKELGSGKIPVQLTIDKLNKVFNGFVVANELKVDPETDTIKVRAQFDNKDKILLPGMFGQAKITYATDNSGIQVPMQTIQKDKDGSLFVFVVDDNNKIIKTPIQILDSASGFNSIVKSGLTKGQKVVFEGTDKIAEGDTVIANELKDKE